MNKKKALDIVRMILCAPMFSAWLLVLAIHGLWGEKLWLDGHILCTELKGDSWPMRTWYKGWGGTTFSYGIMYAKNNVVDSVVRHEMRHVEQLEVGTIFGLIIGVIWALTIFDLGAILIFWLVWSNAPLVYYISAGIISVLRGKNYYRGNLLEEDARNLSIKDIN